MNLSQSSRSLFFWFSLFLVWNFYLTSADLSMPHKFTVGLLGFGIMAWAYFKNPPETPEEGASPFQQEIFSVPAWLPWAVLVLALAVRLMKLTTLLKFPIWDEIVNSYLALHQNEQWDWRPFCYINQNPAFFVWLLAVVFKVTGFSFFVMWLVPALLSFLT